MTRHEYPSRPEMLVCRCPGCDDVQLVDWQGAADLYVLFHSRCEGVVSVVETLQLEAAAIQEAERLLGLVS